MKIAEKNFTILIIIMYNRNITRLYLDFIKASQ